MKTLNEDIKNLTFKKIYLLVGDEEYLRNFYQGAFVKAFSNIDGAQVSEFHGTETNSNDISDAISSYSLFGDFKLIILRDCGLFDKRDTREQSSIYQAFSNIPEKTTVVIIEKNKDERKSFFKLIKPFAYIVTLKYDDRELLIKWLAGKLKGKKITKGNVNKIINLAGTDMEILSHEAEKLMAYTLDKEIISEEDIDKIVTQNTEDKVFLMIYCHCFGKRSEAMKLYQDMVTSHSKKDGSYENSFRSIIYLIIKQYNNLLQVSEMLDEKKSKDEIIKTMTKEKLRPKQVDTLIDEAKSLTTKKIKVSLDNLYRDSLKINTGEISDRLAVECFLMS